MSIRPPFTHETAIKKVKAAQDLWNTKTPAKVALGYTPDTIWRNRSTFLRGREQVEQFLKEKWEKEHFYVLRKELFAFQDNKIAVQVSLLPKSSVLTCNSSFMNGTTRRMALDSGTEHTA